MPNCIEYKFHNSAFVEIGLVSAVPTYVQDIDWE